MGPLIDLAEPTHYAGLKHGMIWTESATGLGGLARRPARSTASSAPSMPAAPTAEGRAFAVIGDPLARRLIDSARKKKVVDLSVVLAEDLPLSWPGAGVGNHRQPFVTISFGLNPNTRLPFDMHMLDSHTGTHLVPPSYALPDEGFDDKHLRDAKCRNGWPNIERKYGRRGTSDVTTEKVPIAQTCGPARVIDVRHLAGSTDPKTLARLAGDHGRRRSRTMKKRTASCGRATS